MMVVPPAPSAEVRWEAPSQCPEEGVLQKAVRDKVGDIDDDGPQVRAWARVHQQEDGSYVAHIDLDGRSRILEAETCEALADAVTLLVAVQVEAKRSERSGSEGSLVPDRVAPSPVAGAETAPAQTDTPRAATESLQARREPKPPRLDAGLESTPSITGLLRGEGIAQFHIVGPVAGAIGIAGGVRIGRARIEGQLRYVPPHELREREQSPSAMVQAVTFGVAGCFEPVWRRLTFPLCGSIHAGGLRGRGRDRVEESVVAWEPWVSGAATAGLRVEVASRVALLLRGGPEVVFLQRRFVVGPQAEPVYDPQRVAGQVALGIEFAFSSRKRPPIPTKR